MRRRRLSAGSLRGARRARLAARRDSINAGTPQHSGRAPPVDAAPALSIPADDETNPLARCRSYRTAPSGSRLQDRCQPSHRQRDRSALRRSGRLARA